MKHYIHGNQKWFMDWLSNPMLTIMVALPVSLEMTLIKVSLIVNSIQVITYMTIGGDWIMNGVSATGLGGQTLDI